MCCPKCGEIVPASYERVWEKGVGYKNIEVCGNTSCGCRYEKLTSFTFSYKAVEEKQDEV